MTASNTPRHNKSFLIAAFLQKIDKNNADLGYFDYHFLRFFKDGWYESLGNTISKRKDLPSSDLVSIQFEDVESYFEMTEYTFVGYYLVPFELSLSDHQGHSLDR